MPGSSCGCGVKIVFGVTGSVAAKAAAATGHRPFCFAYAKSFCKRAMNEAMEVEGVRTWRAPSGASAGGGGSDGGGGPERVEGIWEGDAICDNDVGEERKRDGGCRGRGRARKVEHVM